MSTKMKPTGGQVPGLRVTAGLAAAVVASWAASAQAASPGVFPPNVVPPPMSMRAAQNFQNHPGDWARFVSRLPQSRGAKATRAGALARAGAAGPGSGWSLVTAIPNVNIGLSNPLLLTDGTVLVHNGDAPDWYKLTPDSKGNYANGVWTPIAQMPVIGGAQYSPLYFASAVLPDGRVIVEGGEYNGTNFGVWTNQGAIYDPVADQWTPVNPPSGGGGGWSQIGDAQSVVLPNGSFMLASCCAFPAVNALFNPATLGWTSTGSPTAGIGYQDEQGYELMSTGNVLTIDIWTNYFNGGPAYNAEQYSPLTGVWSDAGSSPVSLPDDPACGTFEIGPAAMRGDGKLIAFGGHTGCVAATAIDPTAIYNPVSGVWKQGPDVPSICGGDAATPCDLADAPAAVEPNGSILFAASSGYGETPTHFFEFSGANKITQVSDPLLNADVSGAYYYNFLVLPNGQVLMTDFTNVAEVYTPAGPRFAASAPKNISVPTTLTHGQSYTLNGQQLGGQSAGAYYGDDAQAATNYPIVKIVNAATGDVAYARTSNFSSMSIANATPSSATFAVPATIETGASTLYVIANGIPSAGVKVTVN
jgi:hypothetical protein